MKKSNITECASDSVSETELAQLVGLVGKHAPRIVQLRLRVEYILDRLSGECPNEETPEGLPRPGLLQRLNHVDDRTKVAIDDLDGVLARLEKLV